MLSSLLALRTALLLVMPWLQVTQYQYAATLLQTNYSRRWYETGMAAVAAGVMLLVSILAYRFINWQRR